MPSEHSSRPTSFLSALTGSFSQPAADNPTVVMMEAAYRHHGLDARYLNCDVGPSDLAAAVAGARAMGWLGFNCSLPHKIAVLDHLDELAPSAAIIGAVNCVVHRNGRLVGENTDGQGFVASLRTRTAPAGKNVVVLGAGGAARAIAVETALAGAASITIVNRDPGRGVRLADLVSANTPASAHFDVWTGAYAIAGTSDIVVNATSAGMAPGGAGPDVDVETLRPELIVADVVPTHPETAFLARAAARGCSVLNGFGMLVNQGVIGMKLWTGIDADPAVMYRTLAAIVPT